MEALRWDEAREALFGIQHGRDHLNDHFPQFYTPQDGADLPSEEFIRIDRGDDNGWPYCYHDWKKNLKLLAPEYGGNGTIVGPRCANKERPLLAFPGHWAPNDLLFYTGRQFPSRFSDGAFVAFHGGFDRAPLPNEGFNVVFVPFGRRAHAAAGKCSPTASSATRRIHRLMPNIDRWDWLRDRTGRSTSATTTAGGSGESSSGGGIVRSVAREGP